MFNECENEKFLFKSINLDSKLRDLIMSRLKLLNTMEDRTHTCCNRWRRLVIRGERLIKRRDS